LQAPRSDLQREAPGDRRHRREDREPAVALADRLVGDKGGAGGERRIEQLRVRRKVLKPEHRLPAPRLAVLRWLQLLYFDDQLAGPGITQRRAGGGVFCVAEADAPSGARLDDHVAERGDAARGQRDAEFAVLYFARYADAHSAIRPGPR